jgi:hypothetical protein
MQRLNLVGVVGKLEVSALLRVLFHIPYLGDFCVFVLLLSHCFAQNT